MFMGEFHHNIDDKARLVMPSKFRYELGEKVKLFWDIPDVVIFGDKDEK